MALLPLIARLALPGPAIVSFALASVIARRSEPAPSSLSVVTTIDASSTFRSRASSAAEDSGPGMPASS